jgi:hypothetical protein
VGPIPGQIVVSDHGDASSPRHLLYVILHQRVDSLAINKAHRCCLWNPPSTRQSDAVANSRKGIAIQRNMEEAKYRLPVRRCKPLADTFINRLGNLYDGPNESWLSSSASSSF